MKGVGRPFVFKAHRLSYHSMPGSRVITKKKGCRVTRVEPAVLVDGLLGLLVHLVVPCRGRWSSNPSEKCSYERPTRGILGGTMRSMCGADASCLAINYQSLQYPAPPNTPKPVSLTFCTAVMFTICPRCFRCSFAVTLSCGASLPHVRWCHARVMEGVGPTKGNGTKCPRL